jgi:exodeoxyribonuclease VII large subunit
MNFISLSELMTGIRVALERGFNGHTFRVLAEITDVKIYQQKQYAFLTLIEKQGADIVASAGAAVWRNCFGLIREFEKTTGVRFDQNLELVLEVAVTFHERYGLRLSIVGIDSSYTLGKLEQEREKVLRKLAYEEPHLLWLEDGDYVSANMLLSKPTVMQRVALISAAGSDGRRDFIKELTENAWGIGYAIAEFPAAVQGQTAAAEIAERLALIAEHASSFDMVALVRGGGSNTDFSAFDDYEVAKRIAGCPKPVFTGIGHDRNVSVADVVCHQMLKTPTRCAAAVTEHNLAFLSVVQESKLRIAQAARRFIEQGQLQIAEQKRRLMNAFSWRLQQERNLLEMAGKKYELLYPARTLATGYALVSSNGKVLKSVQDAKEGMQIEIRLADGTIKAIITGNE